MVITYVLDRGNVIEKKEIYWDPRKTIIIDAYNPSSKELAELSKNTNIPLSYLKDSLDENERPRITDLDNYSHIIYRAPHTENKETEVFSFSLFFSSKVIIILRKHKVETLDNITELTSEHKFNVMKQGTGFSVFWIIDRVNFFKDIDELEDKIDKIEASIFKSQKNSIVRKIFHVKKTLIYFHKAFTANRDVIAAIEKGYLKYIRRQDVHLFREVYNDLVQLVDMEATLRDILTTNLEIYQGTISNNMNEVMKKLTVYASFIMVPTLISGIYGMNFRVMPELFWKYGYLFSILLMVISVTLLYFLFRKKGWI